MSVEKQQIVIIDDGGWVAKCLDYEITNRNSKADVADRIKVDKGVNLKTILDKVTKPTKLLTNEQGEITNKILVWLPFTSDGMSARELRDEYNILRDQYPYLAIHFAYENMGRAYLHELARKYGIVPMHDMVDEAGNSIPDPVKVKAEEELAARIKADEDKAKAESDAVVEDTDKKKKNPK